MEGQPPAKPSLQRIPASGNVAMFPIQAPTKYWERKIQKLSEFL